MEAPSEAGIAPPFSDKVDSKPKGARRDNSHYLMVKGTIEQEEITIVNMYARNNGASNFVKQILLNIKGQININIVIIGDLNTPLSQVSRFIRQNINKEISE